MGASTVLSIDNNFRRAQSKKEIFFRILKRSFYLIALGIVLNSGHRDSKGFLRVCGVLQRIGLTYFIIASLEIFALKSLLNEHVSYYLNFFFQKKKKFYNIIMIKIFSLDLGILVEISSKYGYNGWFQYCW